eukprot:m.420811 g.420811  ORF g.420811 m.420811 type:complete len:236 (+) comp32889_c0_seq1:151-858(+)
MSASDATITRAWSCSDVQVLTLDTYLDDFADTYPSHGDASFTGLWPAAKGFASFLEEREITLLPPGTNVLELGSGTGWLGTVVAFNAHNLAQVLLTDIQPEWLAANLAASVAAKDSQSVGAHVDSVARTCRFDWGSLADRERVGSVTTWDLVLGCDLVYAEDSIGPFVATIRSLLITHRATRVLYCHGQGRVPAVDTALMVALSDANVHVAEVGIVSSEGNPERPSVVFELTELT